jgi:hypothetical protein
VLRKILGLKDRGQDAIGSLLYLTNIVWHLMLLFWCACRQAALAVMVYTVSKLTGSNKLYLSAKTVALYNSIAHK